MKKILWAIGFIAIFASLFFVANRTIFAAEEGANDGVDLKFKIEGSTDNATWVNYSGTDFAGGQTITASPGDVIYWRVKIWNEGPQRALTIDNEAAYINDSYIELIDITNMDLDGDEREYDGGDLDQVNEGTSEDTGYQGVSGSITLKNSFPEGETAIVFGGYVADYTAGALGFAPMPLVSRALAVGVNKSSAIRIVVNTTPLANNTTVATAPVITTLPQTGK